MDETLCQRLFVQPEQTLHRRYEALRAFFVEQLPFEEIARRFGLAVGTVRHLVRAFGRQMAGGQTPPFSPGRRWVGRRAQRPAVRPPSRSRQRSPTGGCCR